MKQSWRREILVIWLGQSISLLSSAVMQMAVIWYLTQTTGSATVLTVATLAAYFPQALLGPLTGAIIDRFAKKVVIACADSFLALTSVLLAFLAWREALSVEVIILVLLLRSIGTAFHEPAAHALTPLLVPPARLTQYAGYSQAFDSICYLLSPGLAVVLYGLWPLTWIFLLDVIGAMVAVVLLLSVPLQEKERPSQGKPRIWKETLEGFAVLRQHEGLLTLLVIGVCYSLVYSPIGSLYPHMTMVYFQGSTAQSGLVEMIFAAGSLLGALILGAVGGRMSKRWGLVGAMVAYGGGILAIGCLPPSAYGVFAILSFFVGISIPFYHGLNRAVYQLTLPHEYLGRALALSQSTKRLGMPLGLLCGGLFADSVGINRLFIVAGCGAIVLGVVCGGLRSLRNLARLPHQSGGDERKDVD